MKGEQYCPKEAAPGIVSGKSPGRPQFQRPALQEASGYHWTRIDIIVTEARRTTIASESRAGLCASGHPEKICQERIHSRTHDDGQISARAVSRLPNHNRGAMTTLHAEVERNAAHQL